MQRRVFQSGCLSGAVNLHIPRTFNDNCIENARRLSVRNCAGGTFFHIRRGSSFTHERNLLIQYGIEVQEARKSDSPIVALESTIITHGMPYPDNLDTAVRVEEIIREQGAIPATIAIFDGKLQVGMSHDRLEKLAKCASKTSKNEKKAMKCSRRDISTAICQKLNGGTTVAGTMTIARMAGIPIMATGGIGGVHRGAEVTLDVSSDLIELSRNPTAVVCAGVKAILDIPKTLEYLETQGVPVVTVGQTDNFPAFYSRETSPSNPVKAPSRVSDAQEAAKLLRIQEQLALETGMLFAVPIPESHALDSADVESIIREALAMAETRGIRGKYVTPYLLQQLNQLTSGGFLKANQALVENNARVAAEMALALSRLRRKDKGTWTPRVQQLSAKPPPAVIGGATVDVVLHVDHPHIQLDGRTHRAKSRESYGGVGRNVAAALVALGLENTRLITVVGEDDAGRTIAKNLGQTAEDIELLSNAVTPRYTAILDQNGECRFGIGEMDTFAAIDENLVRKHRSTIENAGILVLDGNISLETMRASIDIAARNKIPVWYEPTDISKAAMIFQTKSEWISSNGGAEDSVLQFVSPNVNELVAIARYLGIQSQAEESTEEYPSIEWISKLAKGLAERVPVVITTLGSRGLLVTRRASMLEPFFNPSRRLGESAKDNNGPIQSRWYPAPEVQKQDASETFSVSGCGDCLVAAIITGSYRGLNESECVSFALEAAAVSLRSYEPVPPSLIELRNFSVSTNGKEPAHTIN